MNLNPYRPTRIHDSASEARPGRNLASNVLGIFVVVGVWHFWLRTFHDGEFLGWLVLGASVGVLVDGLIGTRRVLTPIVLCVAPFVIAFILANHAMFPLLADAEPGDALDRVWYILARIYDSGWRDADGVFAYPTTIGVTMPCTEGRLARCYKWKSIRPSSVTADVMHRYRRSA